MPTVWEEFGAAVAKARAAKKWNLSALADVAFGNPDRKGYVSQIEKGRTKLHFSTVQKLADALSLPVSVTDPVFRADLPTADEADKVDRDAERLIRLVERDASAPSTAEALLITLAYEFAQGPHLDMQAAYNGLRGALEAADRIKVRGEMPQNTDDQLQAVMREVSRLNDLGQRDEAATALDEALHRADAARDAIVTLQLDQDRIRDVPDAAAARLIARLKASAPPGGVWAATRDLIGEWREKGGTQGLAFDLQVARHLAKQNLARARGAQQGASLDDLAFCQLRLGQRSPDNKYLRAAVQNFTANLGRISRRTDPQNWAMTQNNLGSALSALGEREADPARLRDAVTAHQAALTVRTCDAAPMDWAMTQNNLGNALQTLGAREADPARLRAAITAFQAALEVCTRDAAPMDWAMTQHNLAIAEMAIGQLTQDSRCLDRAEGAFLNALTLRNSEDTPFDWADSHGGLGKVAMARFDLTGDRDQLPIAHRYFTEARAVFGIDPDNKFAHECDSLLARIAALDSGSTSPPSR